MVILVEYFMFVRRRLNIDWLRPFRCLRPQRTLSRARIVGSRCDTALCTAILTRATMSGDTVGDALCE